MLLCPRVYSLEQDGYLDSSCPFYFLFAFVLFCNLKYRIRVKIAATAVFS